MIDFYSDFTQSAGFSLAVRHEQKVTVAAVTSSTSAQAAADNREQAVNMDVVNVNGGAIALGHPIGAAGCRITTTLIYEMIKRDLTIGLATMCIGGGMGEAIIVERDELCK